MADKLSILNSESPSESMEGQERGLLERMGDMENILKLVFSTKSIVSCPATPVQIPGIVAADAFDANDCFGTVFTINVPRAGILYSATYFDLDDEGTQLDLEIFKAPIVQVASDAAFAPTQGEILNLIDEIQFYSFDDHGTSQTSSVKNIGKAYTAPDGKFYIQAVDRSTKNIAAGAIPRVQLQIMSFDPEFGG